LLGRFSGLLVCTKDEGRQYGRREICAVVIRQRLGRRSDLIDWMIDHWVKVKDGFASLSRSPTELWKAYALKFLDSYAYFSFSIILTLFLSREFGFSDIAAGTIYGAYGALVTVYGIVAGWLVDNLGVACSLRVGFFLSLLSRILKLKYA